MWRTKCYTISLDVQSSRPFVHVPPAVLFENLPNFITVCVMNVDPFAATGSPLQSAWLNCLQFSTSLILWIKQVSEKYLDHYILLSSKWLCRRLLRTMFCLCMKWMSNYFCKIRNGLGGSVRKSPGHYGVLCMIIFQLLSVWLCDNRLSIEM